jgi:hypothetical protein
VDTSCHAQNGLQTELVVVIFFGEGG